MPERTHGVARMGGPTLSRTAARRDAAGATEVSPNGDGASFWVCSKGSVSDGTAVLLL